MVNFDATLIAWIIGTWTFGFLAGFLMQYARRLLFLI